MKLKLIGIKEITGRIILKTGLHIGAGDVEMKIGGVDNTVVKHPHTHEPYIPGSSLKGKVRSLLEMRSGLMWKTEGKPLGLGDLKNCMGEEKEHGEKILKIFGASGADTDENTRLGPSRVSFADCPLNRAWKKKADERNWPLTEVKSENAIDRIKGTARDPRFTERVPADAEFDFSLTFKLLEEGEDTLIDFLLDGLRLLEMDALGGSGSRGYGRIRFEFDDAEIRERFAGCLPLPKEG
ncbi:MAG: type III-A CRISPR-associated RAMP protein Csm3 [Pseudomonadota bacterium]